MTIEQAQKIIDDWNQKMAQHKTTAELAAAFLNVTADEKKRVRRAKTLLQNANIDGYCFGMKFLFG